MFIRTFSIHKCFYPSSRSDIKFTRLGPEDQSVMQKDPEERSHSQDLQILVVADGWKKTKFVNYSAIESNDLSANLSSQVVWLPTVSG